MASSVRLEIHSRDRLAAAGVLGNEAKDQLALAPGVRRADNALGIRAYEQGLDGLKLLERLFVSAQLPLLGDHGSWPMDQRPDHAAS